MLSPIKTFLTYFTLRACVYIAGLLIICGLLIYFYQKKYLSGDRMKVVFLSILTIYSATILYLTVLGRRPLDIYHANYVPFSSIRYIFTNMDKDRLIEFIVNILMFVPIGFLVSLLSEKSKLLRAVLLGFGYSFCIEILQKCLSTGYFETDDLIKNTVGAFLGSLLYFVLKKIYIKIKANLYERKENFSGIVKNRNK